MVRVTKKESTSYKTKWVRDTEKRGYELLKRRVRVTEKKRVRDTEKRGYELLKRRVRVTEKKRVRDTDK